MTRELDTRLLALYFGTEDALLEKEAGALDVAGRVAAAALLLTMLDSQKSPRAAEQAQQRLRPTIQHLERQQVQPQIHQHVDPRDFNRGPKVFTHARSPESVDGGDPMPEDLYRMKIQTGFLPDIPMGMDNGMIRLASASQKILEAEQVKEAFVAKALVNQAQQLGHWAKGVGSTFSQGVGIGRDVGRGMIGQLRAGIQQVRTNAPRLNNSMGSPMGAPGAFSTFKNHFQENRSFGIGGVRSAMNASKETGQQLMTARKNMASANPGVPSFDPNAPSPTRRPANPNRPTLGLNSPDNQSVLNQPVVPALQPSDKVKAQADKWINKVDPTPLQPSSPNGTPAAAPTTTPDPTPAPPKQTSWVPGALALGAGAAMAFGLPKTVSSVLDYGEKEQAPTPWGMQPYGAPRLSHSVNQYGQPMP